MNLRSLLCISALYLFMACIAVPNTGIAQKRLLLKAVPSYAIGTDRLLGIATGLETQLGQKTSFSATLNFTKGMTSDQEISDRLINNYDDRAALVTSFGVSVDFRIYITKNILYPLEGFFIGLDAELAQSNFKRFEYNSIYTNPWISTEFLEIQKEQYMTLLPGISLGFAKNISEKLSFEVSSGLRVEVSDEDGSAFIPIRAGLRYAIK